MSEIQESDKVVCVNDSPEGVFGVSADMLHFPRGSVIKGNVYCVERVYPGENGTQGLILTEPKIFRREGGEIGFNSTRFRKVHPREIPAADERASSRLVTVELKEPVDAFTGCQALLIRDEWNRGGETVSKEQHE